MITIRDQHLEDQIDRERQRRGDSTLAKTLSDLVREKLTEMEAALLYGRQDGSAMAEKPELQPEPKKVVHS